MAISFRIARHSVWSGVEVVEILENGAVVGVMYPQLNKTVKVVSAHIENQERDNDFAGNVVFDDGTASCPPIPSITIKFNPSPYRIVGNRIVRERLH